MMVFRPGDRITLRAADGVGGATLNGPLPQVGVKLVPCHPSQVQFRTVARADPA